MDANTINMTIFVVTIIAGIWYTIEFVRLSVKFVKYIKKETAISKAPPPFWKNFRKSRKYVGLPLLILLLFIIFEKPPYTILDNLLVAVFVALIIGSFGMIIVFTINDIISEKLKEVKLIAETHNEVNIDILKAGVKQLQEKTNEIDSQYKDLFNKHVVNAGKLNDDIQQLQVKITELNNLGKVQHELNEKYLEIMTKNGETVNKLRDDTIELKQKTDHIKKLLVEESTELWKASEINSQHIGELKQMLGVNINEVDSLKRIPTKSDKRIDDVLKKQTDIDEEIAKLRTDLKSIEDKMPWNVGEIMKKITQMKKDSSDKKLFDPTTGESI